MHKKRIATIGAGAVCLWLAAGFFPVRLAAQDSLEDGFKNPPADCRIMMRWWWFGPAVSKPELERELRAIKDAGIGGVEVQPVYALALDDPQHGFRNSPYLSDEFIDNLRFAATKARELGLRFDLTLGSGWPFGGPHIPITQAAGKLRYLATKVDASESSAAIPALGHGEQLIAAFLSGESPRPALLRLEDVREGRISLPQENGGPRTVLWFISGRTGMMVKRAAVGAEGFVLDHYDRSAIENHLHNVGDRLFQALGENTPYAIFSDSLEVYNSDWTADFLEQFRQRRGYDLAPYLPELVQGTGPQAADIRRDWGKTLSELVEERYLIPMEDWARAHKTLFRSQTYGIPPVTLSSNRLVDLPEGEGFEWRAFSPTRWAASASHLYGKNITSAETWTWLHSPAFAATPLDLKVEADKFFLQGINQLIGHGWPYSPPEAGEPGWRFYAAGAFDDHNPWWPVMPELTSYLRRVSYLLRQGTPVKDVAILLPTDDAWSQFTPGHVSVSESMDRLLGPEIIPQILNAGYDFGFIDAEAIDRVGISSPVLIMPGVERIPRAVYEKIADYAKKGGIVVATRGVPSRAPGLKEAEADTPAVRELSHSLFEMAASPGHLLEDERKLGELLAKLLKPDVTASPQSPALGFVHRKLADADIYFLANTGNQQVQTTLAFRAAQGAGQSWDPFSGATTSASSPLRLDLRPYESRVIVFGKNLAAISAANRSSHASLPAPLDLSSGWTVTFPKLSLTVQMDHLHSWAEDAATTYYSGEAIYERDISLPASFLHGAQVYFDFGPASAVEPRPGTHPRQRAWISAPVRDAAQILVNGNPAGSVWKPPYELNISGVVHAGVNHVKIVVGNTGMNEMAGKALPDYTLLNSRYGEKFVPQDMQDVSPMPSGLMGPIKLEFRTN